MKKTTGENLYEGELADWWKKLKQFSGKEPLLREAMSQAIEAGQTSNFKPGDLVAHPSSNKACKLVSVDENKMFAKLNDGEKDYEVPYPELFNPSVFRFLVATDPRFK